MPQSPSAKHDLVVSFAVFAVPIVGFALMNLLVGELAFPVLAPFLLLIIAIVVYTAVSAGHEHLATGRPGAPFRLVPRTAGVYAALALLAFLFSGGEGMADLAVSFVLFAGAIPVLAYALIYAGILRQRLIDAASGPVEPTVPSGR